MTQEKASAESDRKFQNKNFSVNLAGAFWSILGTTGVWTCSSQAVQIPLGLELAEVFGRLCVGPGGTARP